MMRLGFYSLGVALLLWTAACSGVDGGSSDDFGTGQGTGGDGGAGGFGGSINPSGGAGGDGGVLPNVDGSPGGSSQGCTADTKYVYVVDSDNTMYRFDPAINTKAAFSSLGKLACNAGSGTPNSMTVGRDGFAYVAYGHDDFNSADFWGCDGIFKVSIKDGSCVGKTAFKCGSAGFKKFGMGFSTDTAGGEAVGLYICDNLNAPALGLLDLAAGTAAKKGNLPGIAEFTGNGKGELWGFFPGDSPPTISQVNKANGAILTSISAGQLPPFGSSGAFAFAYWGGAFYIFYMTEPTDTSTNVWKLGTDGKLTKYISNTNLRIVGAGVSTCAPVEVPK